jgi:hypothetical protein
MSDSQWDEGERATGHQLGGDLCARAWRGPCRGREGLARVKEAGGPVGWDAVTVPGRSGALSGVAAGSPNDAWAVGGDFMEHWTGMRWHREPVGADAYLRAITALAADDVWAVGDTRFSALIEHWDGEAWTPLPLSPSASESAKRLGKRASRLLVAVSASADDNVWAVGYDQRYVTAAMDRSRFRGQRVVRQLFALLLSFSRSRSAPGSRAWSSA